MADRAALVIAVESFFEAGGAIPYATADAADLLRALPSAGYHPDKCLLLTGHRTTKAAIESHLARLPKRFGKGDSLLVMVVSRGFSHRGRGYIACADSLIDDLPGTALPLAELLAAIHKSRRPEATLLLDLDPLANHTGLNETELANLFDGSPSCTALLAAAPGQRSFESATLRRGLWRHHLLEAFTGQAKQTSEGFLTAAALHKHLAEAVPRTLAHVYESPQEQTPQLYGAQNAAAVVADLGQLGAASKLLDASRLRRVVFRSERPGKIRDLAGFRKSHSLPERANEWARKFVNRIAQADIKADLDDTFERIREEFHYKRKDVEVSRERDGVGFIRTPDFEYTVTVAVNPDSPTEVVWRRELSRLADPGLVRRDCFVHVFGATFDRLAFEFLEPLEVAAFVDRIEEHPPRGVKVFVASGSDAAEITVAGFRGRISLTRDALSIEGRGGPVAGLLDQFLNFLNRFGFPVASFG